MVNLALLDLSCTETGTQWEPIRMGQADVPILLFPEKLRDLSEWLRWVRLDSSPHLLEGLPSRELL